MQKSDVIDALGFIASVVFVVAVFPWLLAIIR